MPEVTWLLLKPQIEYTYRLQLPQYVQYIYIYIYIYIYWLSSICPVESCGSPLIQSWSYLITLN